MFTTLRCESDFTGSEVAFALTQLALFIIITWDTDFHCEKKQLISNFISPYVTSAVLKLM